MHILIVEDESLIARFLAHGLQAEGFDTVVARDGGQAIELLASHRWDLVVLDLLLPVADGFAVLAAAQQDPEPPRVLVLSARHSVETKVAALNGGACDYLAKPFSFDELVARVRVHLRVASGPARVAAVGADRARSPEPQRDRRWRALRVALRPRVRGPRRSSRGGRERWFRGSGCSAGSGSTSSTRARTSSTSTWGGYVASSARSSTSTRCAAAATSCATPGT